MLQNQNQLAFKSTGLGSKVGGPPMGVVLVNTRIPFWWLVKMSGLRRSCNRATSTNQPFLASLRPSPSASRFPSGLVSEGMRSNTNNRLPSEIKREQIFVAIQVGVDKGPLGTVKPPTQGLVNGSSFSKATGHCALSKLVGVTWACTIQVALAKIKEKLMRCSVIITLMFRKFV